MFVSGLELWQWVNQAKIDAIASEIPQVELDWLLQELAGLDKLALRLESFKDLPKVQLKLSVSELDRLWQRRLQERVPVQYLTGVAHWRDFSLKVTPAVLIPRPETELLIDLAVDAHAVDCSSEALAVARLNAENLGFGSRINFYQGLWWQPLEFLKGKVSGMVSNPPYIPSSTVLTLQPEVLKHEPHLALDGGLDGLDCIRHLVETAPDYLESGGVWLVEMMAGQETAVADMLQSHGSYGEVQIFSDLAGIDRFALAYRL
ncbi:MAG: peptide chain release factor N(5)-glutamine methyltransferase [Oscillatoriales cyanobacterium]|nr:MAG: peptide chain release factor N(5)-glutamine methyltransferase [Oscillatoriales cyanobacterium]